MAKPIRNMILVRKNNQEQKTSSGLFVPQNVDEKVSTGTVVAVGSGNLTYSGKIVKLEVSVGDTVAFNKNASVEITIDNEKLILLREDQIYCVL